jgi:hypothetical protein
MMERDVHDFVAEAIAIIATTDDLMDTELAPVFEAYAAQEVAKATAKLVAASQLVIDGIKYSEASPTYKGNMAFVEASTGEWTEFQNAVKALEELLHHKVKS